MSATYTDFYYVDADSPETALSLGINRVSSGAEPARFGGTGCRSGLFLRNG